MQIATLIRIINAERSDLVGFLSLTVGMGIWNAKGKGIEPKRESATDSLGPEPFKSASFEFRKLKWAKAPLNARLSRRSKPRLRTLEENIDGTKVLNGTVLYYYYWALMT